ncbi:HAMP domain-containing sensor histidine kinase [Gangjinia marincola]|uniref:histidine kinase n=2 Tax=Gangjinia marincola TaxID=578463 RepID=A0ABP3XQW9_9FLAO
MSLSLIGIIFVQGFWIKSSVESNEEQFSFNAKQILIEVSEKIENAEVESYFFAIRNNIVNTNQPDQKKIQELFTVEKDQLTNNVYTYSNSLIEEDYKLSSDFLKNTSDSITFKKLTNKVVTQLIRKDTIDGKPIMSQNEMVQFFNMEPFEKEVIKRTIAREAAKQPVNKRVSRKFIQAVIEKELALREIETDVEFGIYSNGLPTSVHTDNFELNEPSVYGIALFEDEDGFSNYQLFINFVEKKDIVLSSIYFMSLLSIIFTLIIVIAYSSALSQLIKQRQISQIKTDFINNMTHEFKTPIATINLALDALKNPKARENKDMLNRYFGMIREENKRMHAQVENVLRMSKLERNELNIAKERLDFQEIIESAVLHIELIVENRNGKINTYYNSKRKSVLGNDMHLTNVIVNILDNAVKYSPEEPILDIYTENINNQVVLYVKDHGIGMSKTAQKKIFEKFFREHTGDIHNVKGHGLGLAYAKRIIDDHHGSISVTSEKGKGSTFTIKLPLIT